MKKKYLKTTTCNRCGALISLIYDGTRWRPVDAYKVRYIPDENGGLTLYNSFGEKRTGRAAEPEEVYYIAYQSHWDTCKNPIKDTGDWRARTAARVEREIAAAKRKEKEKPKKTAPAPNYEQISLLGG